MNMNDAEAAVDPIALFQVWMREAEAGELNDPNAVALATATTDGAPSVRMVLLKGLDERGFAFYTNAESRKAWSWRRIREQRCAFTGSPCDDRSA